MTVQPNFTFADETEMQQWLAVNMPGAQVVRTWKVERISCEVIPRARIIGCQLPTVCAATNCYRFETKAALTKFNDEQCGHLQILATWQCKVCNGWHMWCLGAHSDSNGKLPAGCSSEVPERIKKLIKDTELSKGAV